LVHDPKAKLASHFGGFVCAVNAVCRLVTHPVAERAGYRVVPALRDFVEVDFQGRLRRSMNLT